MKVIAYYDLSVRYCDPRSWEQELKELLEPEETFFFTIGNANEPGTILPIGTSIEIPSPKGEISRDFNTPSGLLWFKVDQIEYKTWLPNVVLLRLKLDEADTTTASGEEIENETVIKRLRMASFPTLEKALESLSK